MTTLRASDLDAESRSDLIARAEAFGIEKADVLTRAELIDEIVKRMIADPIERRLARGLLGVARDLVARVVERGLHLPDAAALIRGLQQATLTPATPPIATVTLAEIYAKQGHRTRALAVLDEVLAHEPEHAAARELRERIAALPEDLTPTVAPSEPPSAPKASSSEPSPPVESIAAAPSERAAMAAAAGAKHLDADARSPEPIDTEPTLGTPSEPAVERDTLPPSPDVTSALIATDPLATWQAGPPDLPANGLEPSEVEPLFDTRDADRLVLVPVDATSTFARWELRASVVEAARARADRGELILRIVAVTPSWDGPTVEIRDVEVADDVGDWWVCDLPAGAVLRAAIGWRNGQGFEPLAVALDVADVHAVEALASALPHDDDALARRASIEERARRRAEEGKPAQGATLSSWRSLSPAPWETPYEPVPRESVETR